MIFYPFFKSSFLLLAAYFIGSVPSGYWFARFFFDLDITQQGSGNIGATNIGRTLGAGYFFIIFFADALKAYLFLYSYKSLDIWSEYSASTLAVALLVGNRYSLFLNFKGGKGVATSAGILAFLIPSNLFFLWITTWIATFSMFRQSFLSALIATSILPFVAYYYSCIPFSSPLLFLLIFMTCWLFITHLDNLRRALAQSMFTPKN